MTTINYRTFMPEHSADTVRSCVESLLDILPDWLQVLDVIYDAGNSESDCAAITLNWEYREATMYIYPTFYAATAQQQRHIVRHEFVHLLFGELLNLITEEHSDSREWTRHMEAATEDINYALSRVEASQ